MEIIQEYDNWRRVRDCRRGRKAGSYQSLLSGRRTAIAAPCAAQARTRRSAFTPSPTSARAGRPCVAARRHRYDQAAATANGAEMTGGGYPGWIEPVAGLGRLSGRTVKD